MGGGNEVDVLGGPGASTTQQHVDDWTTMFSGSSDPRRSTRIDGRDVSDLETISTAHIDSSQGGTSQLDTDGVKN